MTSGEQSGVWATRVGSGSSAEANRKISVLIVDGHPQYRRELQSILDVEPDIVTVGEASNGREAIEQVDRLRPDVVLMDVNMPARDGLETTRALLDDYPDLGVILLTLFTGEEHLRQARRAGASGYVLKDAGSDVLLSTIRDVVLGEMPLLHEHVGAGEQISEPQPRPYRSSSPASLLSSNERAILKLLAGGRTNDEIAREVSMSDDMVRTYLEEIYRKLGLAGREAAIQFARQHDIR